MEGIILKTKSIKDSRITYSVLLVESNKTVTVNVFNTQWDIEIGKNSVIEVIKKDSFYNFVKIVKEVDPVGFQSGDEFKDMQEDNEIIKVCFLKAVDTIDPLVGDDIVQKTKELYNAYKKVKEELRK